MIDHDRAFAMYWDLDDGRWLREAPLTDHHGIMGILRRIATKLEEDYMTIEMLRNGNAALVRERDEAEAAQATIKAALDEARRIAAQQYAKHHNGDEDTLVRNFFEFRGWDCLGALEQTASKPCKGGD